MKLPTKAFLLSVLLIPLLYACEYPKSEIKVEEGYKKINGTEIFYKKMGEGESILAVHGGPVLEHSYLVPYLKPLANDFELIFFDQRLSGRSSAESDSSKIRLSAFVDDIEELRKALKLKKIHLMGHSWGGLLAMNYAINYPANLKSIVLLNSMPANSKLWRAEEAILAQKITEQDNINRQEILQSDLFKNNKSEAIEKLLMLSFKNQFYDSTFVDSLDFDLPEDYMIRSQRFGNMRQDIEDYNLHPSLSSIEIPTLLVYGEIEPAATMSGPKLDSLFANSRFVVFQNAGHFPFIEQQKPFLKTVRAFLKNN